MRGNVLLLHLAWQSLLMPIGSSESAVLVKWQGETIEYALMQDNLVEDTEVLAEPEQDIRDNPDTSKLPVVSCPFEQQKTKCFKFNNLDSGEIFGRNLRFVVPKAKLPTIYKYYNVGSQDIDIDDDEDINKDSFLDSDINMLPDYFFKPYGGTEQLQVLETNEPSSSTEDVGFSPVQNTEGGQEVLRMWQSLVGKAPTRTCASSGDYCSVVVEVDDNGSRAFAFCAITNSLMGIGLPFSCDIVAYEDSNEWFVESYVGPELCDGCGAGAGASCYLPTLQEPAAVVEPISGIVKNSMLNISLQIIPYTDLEKKFRDPSDIRVGGKNIATPSMFYAGYYEKSELYFDITKFGGDGEPEKIAIHGHYNMLVTADPSKDSGRYRDISDSNDFPLLWLQQKMIDILKTGLSSELNVLAECELIGL